MCIKMINSLEVTLTRNVGKDNLLEKKFALRELTL